MKSSIKFIDTVRAREEETAAFAERHPKIMVAWLRTIEVLIFVIVVSVIFFAVRTGIDNHAHAMELKAQAAYQAEQEALEYEKQRDIQAAQDAEMARRERETILLAKLIGGLKGFVENYGYTSDDLITYAECPLNRVLNPGFACQTIEDAIMQEGQWVGFSESNEVTQSNYKLARWVINDFYTNPFRIVDNEYCWAELNKDGCYLKKEVELNPYSRTWRYSSNG